MKIRNLAGFSMEPIRAAVYISPNFPPLDLPMIGDGSVVTSTLDPFRSSLRQQESDHALLFLNQLDEPIVEVITSALNSASELYLGVPVENGGVLLSQALGTFDEISIDGVLTEDGLLLLRLVRAAPDDRPAEDFVAGLTLWGEFETTDSSREYKNLYRNLLYALLAQPESTAPSQTRLTLPSRGLAAELKRRLLPVYRRVGPYLPAPVLNAGFRVWRKIK